MVPAKFTNRSSSCRDQIRLNEFIEIPLKARQALPRGLRAVTSSGRRASSTLSPGASAETGLTVAEARPAVLSRPIRPHRPPAIPSVPTANPILGRRRSRRPAHTGPQIRCFGIFSGNNREAREVTLRFANKGALSNRARGFGKPVPGLELR